MKRLLMALAGAFCMAATLPQSLLAAPGDLDPTFGTGGIAMTDFTNECGTRETTDSRLGFQTDGKIVGAGCPGVVRYNQNGILDTTFGDTTLGTVGFVRSGLGEIFNKNPKPIAIQSDDKIVLAGSFNGIDPVSGFFRADIALERFLPDGMPDTTFGTGGLVITSFPAPPGGPFLAVSAFANAVAIQADGKIVVAGGRLDVTSIFDFFHFALARYNTDGSLDPTFGPNGDGRVITGFPTFAKSLANDVVIQADGKIVAAGLIDPGSPTSQRIALVRYNTDGSLDPTFGPNGDGRVVSFFFEGSTFVPTKEAGFLALQPDQKIVVAAYDVNFDIHFVLGRFDQNGSPDPTFNGTGFVFITSSSGFEHLDLASGGLAVQTDGKILLAGRGTFFDPATPGVASQVSPLLRFNPNGTLDSTFNPTGNPTGRVTLPVDPTSLALQADGKIVVAGSGFFEPVTPNTGLLLLQVLARYLDGANTSANTPLGANVVVELPPVTLTFANVTQAGTTTVTTSSTGPPPPAGFKLGNPPTYYDITTTAVFSGTALVCINYTGTVVGNEPALRLFHFQPNPTDVTVSLDTVNNIICGRVTTLSPFAILEPAIQPGHINGEGFINAAGQRHFFEFHVRERSSGEELGRLQYRVRPMKPGRDREDGDDDGDDDRRGPVNRFVSRTVTSVTFSDDPTVTPGRRPKPAVDTVVFMGTGRWNGIPDYTFEARAIDAGEPGRGRDFFRITIKDPGSNVISTVAGRLTGGNIQSHEVKR